jgi:predicted nucleotidyltransferase
MADTAAVRLRDRSDRAGLLASVEAVLGPVRAVMLYGSEARGSASPLSDIDILALVDENPRSTFDADLAITAYLPDHLRALAERGSLFVLHLAHDGVLLYDPSGVLADILAAYRPPAEPDSLRAEFSVVAGGLVSATPAERASFGSAMQSLAFYVLRTAVYAACARRGEPQFDTGLALEKLGLAHLAPLLDQRREGYNASRLDRVLHVLPSVLPGCEGLGRAGLAATAVAVATDCPLASDLLVGVIAGQSVDYTALSLPPT